MIADLKPYPEYEESDSPWLGLMPRHWDHLRAKYLFREVDERSATGREELLSVSHLTGVTPRSQKTVTMFLAKSNVGHKICRPDDVVINTMWAWMGALGGARHAGIVSPSYGVYRPLANCAVLPRYADHLLRTPAYAAEYQRRSTGVNSSRMRLYPEQFLKIEVIVPPRDEQAAIVRFLDWANGRLERPIRAKRKVIALLNEQKQAIIHRAVTRGLDPSAPLKPSGIPWLGDIPQHWDVMPVKRTCSLVRDGTHLPPARTQTGFPLLSVRNMVGGRLVRRPDDSFISKADFEKLNTSFVVRPNDVLMAIVGATLGKVALVDDIGPFQIQRSVSILRPRAELMSHDFLATFLRSPRLQQYLWQSVAFSAQPGIYLGFVANIPVPVPPTIAEQVSIHDGLQRELSPIDTAISRLEREIDLLLKYRTRLVADVVTGKLDVREAAARLPDEEAHDTVEGSAETSDEAEPAEEVAV
jgi:type I restriction enzyme S subunit